MNILLSSLINFVGLPYIYGGKHPALGFDCSGLVQWAFKLFDLGPKEISNAQELFNYFLPESASDVPGLGAVVFYGKDAQSIEHVSFMVGHDFVLEAGGGDHTTLTKELAIAQGAAVRIRPLLHRKDIIAIINPPWPEGAWA